MALFLSSGAFQSQSPLEIAEECGSLGAGLELTSSFKPDFNLMTEIGRLEMPAGSLLIHNYFPPPPEPFVLNLAATRPKIREASLAHCRRAMELCAAKSVPFYSVHAGFAMNLEPRHLGRPGEQAALPEECFIPHGEAVQSFKDAVAELADLASRLGLGLLLENNVITPVQVAAGRGDSLLLTTPDDCADFLQKLNHPTVGLLLDVAHAKVSGRALGFDPSDFFDLPSHVIRALHLSDNDGSRDNNLPIRADSWFADKLRAVSGLPMVIEVYNLSPEQRAAQVRVLLDLLQ